MVPVYFPSQGPSAALAECLGGYSVTGKAPRFPAPGSPVVKTDALRAVMAGCAVFAHLRWPFELSFEPKPGSPSFIFTVTPLKEMRLWQKSSFT